MKYEIEIERKHRGVVLEIKKQILESNHKPKVGECKALLLDPPIYETVISVREITCDHKWKDTGCYVETNRYEYECPFTGETLEEVNGYTTYYTECLKCGEIK